MPWTDPTPAIGVKKPIRASTHLALFANFAAMANGEPGAPRIQVPQALATSERDTNKTLRPDGNGGVTWGAGSSLTADYASGRSNSTGIVVGSHTWLFLAQGSERTDNGFFVGHDGFCFVRNTAIVFSSALSHAVGAAFFNGWSITGGRVYFMRNINNTTTNLLGLRL